LNALQTADCLLATYNTGIHAFICGLAGVEVTCYAVPVCHTGTSFSPFGPGHWSFLLMPPQFCMLLKGNADNRREYRGHCVIKCRNVYEKL